LVQHKLHLIEGAIEAFCVLYIFRNIWVNFGTYDIHKELLSVRKFCDYQ